MIVVVAQLLEKITTMAGENIVLVLHNGEYYNVVSMGGIDGSLVLVIRDTPNEKKEGQQAQIDPDFDDDQSQEEEDTSDNDHPGNEDSEDTNLEEILEELEGSGSGIYPSHVHNSVITRDQAAKYGINQREAA
jgi:hypothetical protein